MPTVPAAEKSSWNDSLPPPVGTPLDEDDAQDPSAAPLWWSDLVALQFRAEAHAIPVDVPSLMALAAQHSGRVQAVQLAPWITGTQLDQARAAFDPNIYTDTKFDSISDPVGNTLITGGPSRLEEDAWSYDGGLRGQTRTGANYDLSQRFGHTNSNSTFFIPNDQGTARLSASLNQPLLRGRAIDFNRSLIITTQFETEVAQAQYFLTLQKQMYDVAETYWQLYAERVSLIQRQRHLERALEIAEQLEARRGFDAVESQVLRTRAAVSNRRAELIQSDATIRNLETRLRALTNAPQLGSSLQAELIPMQPAVLAPMLLDVGSELQAALRNRPEILELQSQIGAANVRLQLAQNQTKPKLNLVAEGYLAGLQGSSDVFGAWESQFSEGRPGYAGGVEFELPYRNRAANAQLRGRRYEVARLEHLMRETEATISADVESVIRNAQAARAAALSRRNSVAAVMAEVEFLEDRWRTLRGDPQLGQLQLDDLLNAHVRLLDEEQALLTALVNYNRAILEVQRATGTLVQGEPRS